MGIIVISRGSGLGNPGAAAGVHALGWEYTYKWRGSDYMKQLKKMFG
jgi:hypothetical protein